MGTWRSRTARLAMKLLIAGGGTGGHVFPALEVARAWRDLGGEDGQNTIVFVGTARGLETRLIPAAGFPLELIHAAGLKGIGGMRLLRNAAYMPLGLWDSAAILRKHRPSVALGIGGYASGPIMLAAVLSGIPTAIFEPNFDPGFTNRILGGMVTRAATAFPATAERWDSRGVFTGCPVRREFFQIEPREHHPPFRILVTGGSQGAEPINRAVLATLPLLKSRRREFFIVHQTGEHGYNSARIAYAQYEFQAEILPFISNMAEHVGLADLIICRAGAITAAEISAAGRAAIFIPFGAAADAHQLRNAQWLHSFGAGRVIPQDHLTPERLVEEISSLLGHPDEMRDMERRVHAFARPWAARHLAELLAGIASP
jgi:UDP-N-acetylglucosamine--N-acetylmuramyl-(pentapeptide) pyrophosphoryl-undecaprenol N-acetylglucosamine transferase